MEPDDVPSMVAAAAAGDRAAWDAIVRRYAGLVWSVARAFRLGDADAADVSQATWLRLVEHLDQLRDPAALGAWLATTARREALTVLRRRPVGELPRPDSPELIDPLPPPWHATLTEERDREVWQAFAHLSAHCQAVLRLLVIEPAESYAAAAAALDLPVGSLGPTRARCLAALRPRLRAYLGEEGATR
jgi:RNA polymerase sigma factor (sigma-70 family)